MHAGLVIASRRKNAKSPLSARATADARETMTKVPSMSGRSLSYTAYEGNSWQTTFDQSGVRRPVVFAVYTPAMSAVCRSKQDCADLGLDADQCHCACTHRHHCTCGPLAGRRSCICKSDMAVQRAEGSAEGCSLRHRQACISNRRHSPITSKTT